MQDNLDHQKACESENSIEIDEKLKDKIDDEDAGGARTRQLTGFSKTFVTIFCIAFAVLQIYFNIYGMLSAMIHTAMFVAFAVALCFMTYKPSKKLEQTSIPWYDWLLACIGAAPFIYVVIDYNAIIDRASRPTTLDIVMTIIALIMVLECVRRTVGNILPGIAIVFLAYAFFGSNLPGILGHRGYDLRRITSVMLLSSNGLFSSSVRTAATMVFMFVLFGSYLNASGAGHSLTNICMSLAGRYTGGPAKVAVISSAAMGCVSGSSTANVITTGQITIPMMIRTGYDRYFAAAVEAAASTGGTLTPPVMGAAAFVLVELTGIPYSKVMIAAALPAFLYYTAVMMSVHFEAKKKGLLGIEKSQLPNLKEEILGGLNVLIPLVMLIYLIVRNYPVSFSAWYSTIALVVMSFLNKKTRMSVKQILDALAASATSVLQPACACACAGIIVGIMGLTGLGVKFSSLAMTVGSISPFLALLVTMVICVILGMGLPVVASYIVGAAIAAPALINLGFPTLAAHLFVFFFCCVAPITPPVAVTAYIAAGMAKAPPLKTAITACSLGIPVFIVPYLLVYNQALMCEGTAFEIIFRLLVDVAAFVAFSAAYVGFFTHRLKLWERAAFLFSSVCLIILLPVGDYVGIAGFVIMLVYSILYDKKHAKPDTLGN